jgi:hypothetical protein
VTTPHPTTCETASETALSSTPLKPSAGTIQSSRARRASSRRSSAPELLPASTDRPARRSTEWQIARRYAYDPEFRADLDSRPVPEGADEPQHVDGGPGGTAAQLASLWSAIGHGTFPGADVARRIAEQDSDAPEYRQDHRVQPGVQRFPHGHGAGPVGAGGNALLGPGAPMISPDLLVISEAVSGVGGARGYRSFRK